MRISKGGSVDQGKGVILLLGGNLSKECMLLPLKIKKKNCHQLRHILFPNKTILELLLLSQEQLLMSKKAIRLRRLRLDTVKNHHHLIRLIEYTQNLLQKALQTQ